jgi:hypothetical protein
MGFNCKYALFVSNRSEDSGRSHVFIAQGKVRVPGSVGASFYSMRFLSGILLFNEIKQISLIKRNFKFLQQCHIFLLECLFLMMHFPILDILYYRINMRLRIRRNSISFLPLKSTFYPIFAINKFVALHLNLLYKIGD